MMTTEKIDKLSREWLLNRLAWLERERDIALLDNARLLAQNEALKRRVGQEKK